jgi:hypothetical protein
MGAPRKHPPKDAAKTIEALAAQGHSIIGIAKKLSVSRETFKRWCEVNEALQEAFEVGRETERHALHSLIVQSAVMNKPANANAMFLLKARHGYRENDSSNTNVNVGVAVATPVMVVRDHGTDEEWEARAAAQQRELTLNAASPTPIAKTPVLPAPAHVPTAPPPAPSIYDAPAWRGNA